MTRRHAISDGQKKALRDWYHAQYPQPRQRACIPWFKEQFDHQLGLSSVCEILSKKYEYLDSTAPSAASLASTKHRSSNWPLLEEALFDWQQIVEEDGEKVSGDVLIEKAKALWNQIPQYQGQPVPEFSAGWLTRYRRRHELLPQPPPSAPEPSASSRSGAAVSAAVESAAIKSVQTLSGEYPEPNVYAMAESGLYWRQSLYDDRSLIDAVRKDRSRITLVTCTNCTGTDRLPLWIIGQQQAQGDVPRSLRGINVHALGGVWRSERTTRVTSLIVQEWLSSFYAHVGNSRPVLLLMDDLEAHVEGANLAPPPPNIRIQWLPVKAAANVYQPLGQGIIHGLKTFYRKKWLQYMMQQFESGSGVDPVNSVNMYQAVHWILQAWKYDVANSAVYSSFRKSTIIQPHIPSLPHQSEVDLSSLYIRAQEAGRIRYTKPLSEFLNPANENAQIVDTTQGNGIQGNGIGEPMSMPLGSNGLGTLLEPARTETSNGMDDGPAVVQPPPLRQALECVKGLLLYEEWQDDTEPTDIQYLERLQRHLIYKQYVRR